MSFKRRLWVQNSFKECRRRPVHDFFYDVVIAASDSLDETEIEATIRRYQDAESISKITPSDYRHPSSFHSLS